MRHCGSKPARYSWQCIAPKTQHQKYIAPKTKKQCTKDALHNSNHTNEAPTKLPMHSIPKVHIHNTRLAQSVGLSCSVKSGLKIFVLFVFTFRDKLWQKRRKFGFSRQKRRKFGFSRQKCYNLGFLQGKCYF